LNGEKTLFVKDMTERMPVDEYFAVKMTALYPSKQRPGESYLRIQLMDQTGVLEGRVWEFGQAAKYFKEIKPDDVVRVRGQLDIYQGTPQLKIERMVSGEVPAAVYRFFRPSLPEEKKAELADKMDRMIASIGRDDLRDLIGLLWEENKEMMLLLPAGMHVHHNYEGGWLEHTLEVMEIADHAASIENRYADRDILRAGAFLHDIGKLKEYDAQSLSFRQREEDLLMGGHIPMGIEILKEAAMTLGVPDMDTLQQLMHMIYAHHGVAEWGSPDVPKTIEALILHHSDLMSARMSQAKLLIEKTAPSERFSGYDKYFGTKFYIPNKRREEGENNESI